MKKPAAVLISDVHYNINTLEVADKAMRLAINKANELKVRLIVCGDLHDTKANIRGECIKAIMETFSRCDYMPIILRGNHDSINEKSTEHSLEFLRLEAGIVKFGIRNIMLTSNAERLANICWFIPYQHDTETFRQLINAIPEDAVVFMHQGVINSNSGHYIQDKSAIPKEWLAGRRVISGHYHTRQDIELPEGGLLSYVGNPYTLGFGEANDPEKGYQILYDDGSLEFVPTKLRRHRVIICGWDDRHDLFWPPVFKIQDTDIVWIKVKGPTDRLSITTKEWLKTQFHIPGDFRLDLIPNDTKSELKSIDTNTSKSDILDSVINNLQNTDDERKTRLKQLWRKFT